MSKLTEKESNELFEMIVDKLGVDREEVVLEANLCNDLGADSLDEVELVMEAEKMFDVSIPDADAEEIKTVQNLVDKIELFKTNE